jgi:lipopolysaccharide export system permease protein
MKLNGTGNLPFVCLFAVVLYRCPLGAIIRKGGLGMPVVVSVFFFVIYYVINIIGEKSAKIGTWPSWLGMWISGIIFLPLGVFLTYKAARDSTIMNVGTYFEFVKRFGKFCNKIYKNSLGAVFAYLAQLIARKKN